MMHLSDDDRDLLARWDAAQQEGRLWAFMCDELSSEEMCHVADLVSRRHWSGAPPVYIPGAGRGRRPKPRGDDG